jgi:hypothetical protein
MNRGRSPSATVGIGVFDDAVMRLAFVLLLAACGPHPLPPRAPAPAPPPCPERRPADLSAEGSIARPTDGDTTAARRADILRALDALDRQLDAIDVELAAAAQNTGLSLVEARANAIARKAVLDAFDLDETPASMPGTPPMLARAMRAILGAKREHSELGRDLGAQHPLMLRIGRRIEYLRGVAKVQLAAERAFTQAWLDTLAKLPEKAKPDAIYKARLQALLATLPTGPSSDSPADVRVAHDELTELLWTYGELTLDFGPKHPDVVVATARLDEAKAAMTKAIADAETELSARIAAPVKHADNAAIARRSELADQARELRREYERLVR